MPSLATLWWPSLDPFGPTLAAALAVVFVAWILVEIPATSRIRGPLLVACLVVFGGLMLVFPADLVALSPVHLHIKYRRFPDLSDYLGNYLLLGAAVVFALKLARLRRPWWQEIGIVSTVVIAGVALVELGGLVWYGKG
jgi:hypothetical protein